MKIKYILPLTLFVLHSIASFAQVQVPHESYSPLAGRTITSAEILPPSMAGSSLTEQLDFVFDSLSAETKIKGWSAAMYLPDGSIWERASGLSRELPEPTSLSTDHLLGMGSITKSFVAATILLMQEEGLLNINDTIGKYLAPYPNVNRKATIKHLLGHRSGINDYLNENPASVEAIFTYPDSIWVTDTVLHHYVLAPNFSPGNWWSYSNTNYLLAERIIENVTGKRWYEVVRERILDPYGLDQTFAYPFEDLGDKQFSNVWLDLDGNSQVEDVQGSGISMDGFFSMAAGAGSLVTTPEDLVKFSTFLYGGSVLADTTLQEMKKRQTPMSIDLYYGLGTLKFSLPQNLVNWGHDGNIIYKSIAMHMPAPNISIAVQQNDDRLVFLADTVNYDLYDVFLALLDTYLNYEEPVSTAHPAMSLEEMKLFPNPARDQLSVSIHADQPTSASYAIMNSEGKWMSSGAMMDLEAGQNNTTLYLESLPEGVYILQLRSENQVLSKPFIITNDQK